MTEQKHPRELNVKQHNGLDRLVRLYDEGALGATEPVVVGWIDQKGYGRGPIIQFHGGSRSIINVTGREKTLS